MYPFSMYGRVIQTHRYSVTYGVEVFGEETGDYVKESRTEYCHTKSQADAVAKRMDGIVTGLDSSAYGWLDGIEVADVPDTYAEAARIYEMGREAYETELLKPTPEEELAALKEQNAALETQLTDTQLALCDFYESVVV